MNNESLLLVLEKNEGKWETEVKNSQMKLNLIGSRSNQGPVARNFVTANR